MDNKTLKNSLLNIFEDRHVFVGDEPNRTKASEIFKKNELPTQRDENWRQTNLKLLYGVDFTGSVSVDHQDWLSADVVKKHYISGLEAHTLVFVNGRFAPQYSDFSSSMKLIIASMKDAKQHQAEAFINYFESTGLHSDGVFAAMNTGFADDGIFIQSAENSETSKPIHLLYLSDGSHGDKLVINRNLIVAGANSRFSVIESYNTIGAGSCLSNLASEIVVNENASVDLLILQQEGNEAVQLNMAHVIQKKGSSFSASTITLSGGFVRNEITVDLKGEHCETALNGLYLAKGTQHIDNYTFVHHLMPNCNSSELYKGIANDKSTTTFTGKVLVEKNAQKTASSQSNKNISLSKTAKMNSKPQLVIHADDVACSHGSTTGQLDQNAIFYMQARGIGKETARALLLFAFANEVVEKIAHAPLQTAIRQAIEERLYGSNALFSGIEIDE